MYCPFPKNIYKASVCIFPLFRLPGKIGGERNMWNRRRETLLIFFFIWNGHLFGRSYKKLIVRISCLRVIHGSDYLVDITFRRRRRRKALHVFYSFLAAQTFNERNATLHKDKARGKHARREQSLPNFCIYFANLFGAGITKLESIKSAR